MVNDWAMKLRILLVDAHEIVRLGLKTLMARYPQFEVVGEACDAHDALKQTMCSKPDVVIIDRGLSGKSGVEASQEILQQHPQTKLIVLTSYAKDDIVFDIVFNAMTAGASSYVLKQMGSDELVRALMSVARGESLLDPANAQPVIKKKVYRQTPPSVRQAENGYFASLTDKELNILALVTDGLTNKQIAKRVFLSEKTVRNYMSSILSKLNLSSRAEAAVYAVRNHIEEYLPGEKPGK
jgi:DNA-binding NarL/FixJ family response regulator